jgi:hypothetical protein
MSTSDRSGAKYAALLKLAEAKFGAWLVEVQHPERERRTKELVRQHRNVGFSDRATYLLALEQKLLQTAVRKRITIYADVARKQNSLEMLSEPRLAELRERNMTLVKGSLTALKGLLGRAGNAVGAADSAFPAELMYAQIEAKLLDVVNSKLRVLAAEGEMLSGGVDDVKAERVSYLEEINAWMKRENLPTLEAARKHLGISLSALKSMRTKKGKPRYGAEALDRVLAVIREQKRG